MNIVINKYITTPDYTEKTYLPGASSGVSLCSFFIVVGPPVVTAGASISLVFLVGNAVLKTLLEIMTWKEKKTKINERLSKWCKGK